MKYKFVPLALLLAITLHAEEKLFSGLGHYHHKITTSSRKAQEYFDQGLAFLFAFNHDEAIRSFTEASKLDPKSTMVWWGLANANGPHINNPMVDEPHQKAAWAAVEKGLAAGNSETKLEHELMQATAKRFSKEVMKDRAPLDKAYAEAMGEVYKSNKPNPDLSAFYAESLMDLHPWDFYDHSGAPREWTGKILAVLRSALKTSPNHPQLIHLLIHAVEAGANPYEAATPGDRLRDMQPTLGHMVHMPSHIDVRLGNWKKAVLANEKAIASDSAYRKIRPVQGFYHVYMTHNHHMLGFAAMMSGQSAKAIKAMDELVANMPVEWAKQMAPYIEGFMAMPIEARVRFGKWDEVLASPDLPNYFPGARALRHVARAIAFSAKRDLASAKKEQNEFLALKAKVPGEEVFGQDKVSAILTVAEHLMNGEMLIAEHKVDDAIAELEMAVKAEDALNYMEPPDWIQPTRHTLGALLLKAGKNKQAIEVYTEDLKKLPHNVWSLHGMAQAYEGLGEKQKAADYKAQFDKVSAENHSDTQIDTSCLCIKPEGKV